MNVLFITFNDIYKTEYGGSQCTIRNLSILKKFFNVTTYIIEKNSLPNKVLSSSKFYFPPSSNKDKKNIDTILEEKKIDIVFSDTSLIGNILKNIKKERKIKIISFFHNVEFDYINVRFSRNNLLKNPYKFLAFINEKNTIDISDKIITLTRRDSIRLKDLYGRMADDVIPITFDTKITTERLELLYKTSIQNNKPIGLFVGSFVNANYKGIKWFVENISEHINANIIIAGKGFEKVESELSRENVNVVGFVKNLEDLYIKVDFVVSPILFGGGMKVKIAEALMYGKTIFGTKEAFEGYDFNYSSVGSLCYDKDEFIEKINKYCEKYNKYNKYSRKIYNEKYNNDIALNRFYNIITFD